MKYKVIVPRELVSPHVTTEHDSNNDYVIQMRIKWSFIPEVEEWWNMYMGEVPRIMISRRDFDPPDYWVGFDIPETAEAFKLAWY